MPVKIRLMRIGAKKRPFYRVVAVDERKKRTGGYLELLGTYNPLTQPKEIKLNQEKIDDWIKKGAQLSHGFLRIIGKAPQKPPRKPKKARLPDGQEKKVTDDSGQKQAQEGEQIIKEGELAKPGEDSPTIPLDQSATEASTSSPASYLKTSEDNGVRAKESTQEDPSKESPSKPENKK